MIEVAEDPSALEAEQYEAEANRLANDHSEPEAVQSLGSVLQHEFAQAEKERDEVEQRWLEDLRQYRGKYDAETLTRIGPIRSKAFVRKTRVKVKTIDSRVADLLFPAGSEKNWQIEPTPKPSISADALQQIKQYLSEQHGGPQNVPREAFDSAVMEVAKGASRRMSTTIDDQLTEARYKDASVKTIHSGHLYGTGVMKGPLVERRVRTKFKQDQKGKWIPVSERYVVPFVEHVPLWRFYPDMSATCIEDCRYVYERHSMPKHRLAALADRKSFNGEIIRAYIIANPSGQTGQRHFDTELQSLGERSVVQGQGKSGQYEVLERWGWLDGEQLCQAGVKVPEDRKHESFFSNVWMLPNGQVIRAVLQPIDGSTWPYHLYYFDKDESSIFGEGLAAVMRDDQAQLNAAVRMMLDNAALTSGPQIEVSIGLLAQTERADEIHPWKVWLRNREHPERSAVRAVEIPSRLADLSAMAQLFEANADEVTAIPRYMSGENATRGAAGTAAGMSMLMGAANIVIKDLITSWDEGVTRPFMQSLYQWNMKFSKDRSIKGDFEVKARGTSSLVAKEVRTRQLSEFSAMTGNPLDAPYVKRDVLLRQIAEAAELSGVVKTEEEIKAEVESDQAKQAAELQQKVVMLQLQEAQARANKLTAEAELTMARAQEALKNIELKAEQIVETRVRAMFASLQAGGVAVQNPFVAPAGDEIYRSAGGKDATPDTELADLNRQPVQETDGTHQVLNKGASFAEQPRGGEQGVPLDQPMPGDQTTVQPQTGQVGANAGIETTRID